MRQLHSWTALAVLLFLFAPTAVAAPPTNSAGVQFFEQKIRPILVKHCYECHSAQAKRVRGGLKLDTRQGLLEGGDTGPALVPGKPVESLILKALRHDEIAMPPKGKLSEEVIASFERWIRMGAPDPRDGKPATIRTGIDLEAGRKFWAFQPPRRHAPPTVRDSAWPRSDIDRFILPSLEAKHIGPVRDADPLTLIRRVTFDLTGLPPTPDEIDAFQRDTSPDALARVVDRLLASPAYGERWGRHWLDVARYADSNGKDENLTFHNAWRYRDWVIRSFNEDRPYNQFVAEQVAGDLLPTTDGQQDERLTATGFLVVGPKVLADRDQAKRRMDVVDEQIDTVGRTFLGLTLGCARCHDHKFDPLPTTDYYALAGIFTSTRTLDGFKLGNPVVSGWSLRPLGGPEGAKRLAARSEYEKQLKKVADAVKKAKAELTRVEDRATMRLPSRLVGIVVDDKQAKRVGVWKKSTYARPYVGEGYIHDDKAEKGGKSVIFTPDLPKAGEYEVFISYTAAKGRSTNTPVTVRFDGGEKTVVVNQEQRPALDGLFRSVGKYRFAAGKASSVTMANKGTLGHVIVDAVRWVPLGALEKDADKAMGIPEEVRKQITQAKQKVAELEAEEKRLKASAPPAPELVMAVRDEVQPADARINVRGNPHSLGPVVPRGFVTVATTAPGPRIAGKQSGRRELADWLADRRNPLTARVMVNRVWLHLFGEGIVRTVDNFGVQGEKPSHPELLDTMAVGFMEDGWSVKRLVRRIVLSRTYQLAAVRERAQSRVDPENRLFWRAHRRRLEAEAIRDSILAVSGRLDRVMGGSSVEGLGEAAINNSSKGGVSTDTNQRRSVYLPVIRNDLPPIFEVFDFADPDVAIGRRDATTVATQALYLMNSPFVMQRARDTAMRLLAGQDSGSKDDGDRLTRLYRQALGRAPTERETARVLQFVKEYRQNVSGKRANEADVEAWAAVCQAVFGSTEFRFVE